MAAAAAAAAAAETMPSASLTNCKLSPLPAAASYGDRAAEITRIAEQRKLGKRIVRGYPILEAEVIYAGGQKLITAAMLHLVQQAAGFSCTAPAMAAHLLPPNLFRILQPGWQ